MIAEYAWEKEYERTWEQVQEDESGRLTTSASAGRLAAGVVGRASGLGADSATTIAPTIRRGLMRFVVLILDTSVCMNMTDMTPTRRAVACEALREFCRDFFDQNPVSSMGLVAAGHRRAAVVVALTSSVNRLTNALDALAEADETPDEEDAEHTLRVEAPIGGDWSLLASLEAANDCLAAVPSYGKREVVVVHGALATHDAADISSMIARLARAHVRCSILGLAGEMFICKRLAEETDGSFAVAVNVHHLHSLLEPFRIPPPSAPDEAEDVAMVPMGFASLITDTEGIMIPSHTVTASGYKCPRCLARVESVPCECPVCTLRLVASPHLARSFHHLFPVQPFAKIRPSTDASGGDTDRRRAVVPVVDEDTEADQLATAARWGSIHGVDALQIEVRAETAAARSAKSLLNDRIAANQLEIDCDALLGAAGVQAAAPFATPEERRCVTAARVAIVLPGATFPTPSTASSSASASAAVSASASSSSSAGEPASAAAQMKRGLTTVYSARATHCSGCHTTLLEDEPCSVCRRCLWTFCVACDTAIHEEIHSCPGCPV